MNSLCIRLLALVLAHGAASPATAGAGQGPPAKSADVHVPGSRLDEVLTPRHVEGHLLSLDGDLLVAGWSVQRFVSRTPAAQSRQRRMPIDPSSGTFTLDVRGSGSFQLVALGPSGFQSEPFAVDLVAGRTTEVVHVIRSVCRAHSLEVDLQSPAPSALGPCSVTARTPAGALIALQRSDRGTWVGSSDEEGEHTLLLDHARFQLEDDRIHTGSVETIRLQGTASLEFVVTDAVTGDKLVDYGVAVRYPGIPDERGCRRELLRPGQRNTPPSPLRVVPGEIEVAVWDTRRPMVVLHIGAVGIGERRTVPVELAPGFELRGRVLDSAGAPVAGAAVALLRGDFTAPGETADSPSTPRTADAPALSPIPDCEVESSADGTFVVHAMSAGRWTAHVSKGPWVTATSAREIAPGDRWDLSLPEHTEVLFEFAHLRGEPATSCELFLSPAEGPPIGPRRGRLPSLRADDEGRFPPVTLPIGQVDLELRMNARRAQRSRCVVKSGGPMHFAF